MMHLATKEIYFIRYFKNFNYLKKNIHIMVTRALKINYFKAEYFYECFDIQLSNFPRVGCGLYVFKVYRVERVTARDGYTAKCKVHYFVRQNFKYIK